MLRHARLKVILKRAYEAPTRSDGQRILVDRYGHAASPRRRF
jgi:uncharacterized protein YeaO (DUF488 family)